MSMQDMMRQLAALSGEERIDAGEVAFLEQQLEHMKARVYEVIYERLKLRSFLPVDTDADMGAEAIAWQVYDEVGEAALLANDGDDIPLVDATATKQTKPVYTVASAYQYSVIDLWRSRKASMSGGQPLDFRRARNCRRAIERKIDQIGATGIPGTSARGLFNQTVITPGSPSTGNWIAGGASATEILDTLNKAVTDAVDATKGELPPDTVLLPTAQFAHIATKRVGTDSAQTILQAFLQQNPWITSVDWSPRLDAAGAGSSTRMAVYPRDPEVLTWDIPLDFFQLPPQAKGIGFFVPCLARVSGVTIHHPTAVQYIDGI